MRFADVRALPALGVGLGFRGPLARQIRQSDAYGWLELLAEEWLPVSTRRRRLVDSLRARGPLVLHGTELSVGSVEPPPTAYLAALRELAEVVDPPWFSDHLCVTRDGDRALGHLGVLPWRSDIVDRVASNAASAQAVVGRPLLLENISYHFTMPGDLTEPEFMTAVLATADCGMLLDVTNCYTNAVNFGFDPVEQIEGFPLERVVEVHIAGGRWVDGFLEDSHDAPVMPEVWRLLELVLSRAAPRAVLLERDARFPDDFAEIQADLDRARELFVPAPVPPGQW